MAGALALSIDRLQLDVRAAVAHDRSATLLGRLRDAVANRLPTALERLAKSDNASGGEPYVFIDELRIAYAVNAALKDDEIVSLLAARVARVVAEGRSQQSAVVYRDRAEFIAALFVALVDGVASQRWWFDEFDGLRPLPTSQALRTLICDTTEPGLTALLRLTPNALTRTIAALDQHDLARVLTDFRALSSVRAPSVARLWQLLPTQSTAPPEQAALVAVVAIERAEAGSLSAVLVDSACSLAHIARALRDGRLRSVACDSRVRLVAWLERENLPVRWLVSLDSGRADELIHAISARALAQDMGTEESPTLAQTRTDFGGAFVLIVVANWLGWPVRWYAAAIAQGASVEGAATLARSLLLRIVASALAAGSSKSVQADLGLHAALLLDAAASRAARRYVCAALVASGLWSSSSREASSVRHEIDAAAKQLLQALADRVPGCCGSSAAYLRRNLLSASAAISIEASRARVTAALSPVPLQVLLEVAGLARAAVELPGGLNLRLRSESWA